MTPTAKLLFNVIILLFHIQEFHQGYTQNTLFDPVFTSPKKIKLLHATVEHLSRTIEDYVSIETTRIQEIQNYIDTLKKAKQLRTDKLKYLSNPLNVYHLAKRLSIDWQQIQEKARENRAQEMLYKLKANEELVWPETRDLHGIADSILNTQNVNRLQAIDLVAGRLGHLSTNVTLTFEECYILAERGKENMHYKLALDWAAEASKLYFKEGIVDEDALIEIVYIMSLSLAMNGDNENALLYIRTYFMMKTTCPRIKNLEDLIRSRVGKPSNFTIYTKQMYQNMTRLCSIPSHQRHTPNITCRYNFENSPFLTIAPLKEETLSIDPKIILFHAVIYDSEIEKIIEEAKYRMHEEATPTEIKTNKVSYERRLSEVGRFDDTEFQEIEIISSRIKDIISKKWNYAPPFQVTNYGVGGYFYEHSDLILTPVEEIQQYEKRQITVQFNLNDVMKGGATIFPQIDLKVETIKGDALLWYNFLENGYEDDRVRHATCPILYGYKWELTKWINQKDHPKNLHT